MACQLTQGYNLDCRLNYGGVSKVFIMEYDNASAITESAGVVTAITKVATKLFREYKLVAHTGEADEAGTLSRENGTSMVKQSVKFPVNKMTTSVRNEILLLAQNRLLIVVLDENGTAWLYGKDYGMMLDSFAAKTGKALGDRNGYELAFSSDEKNMACALDGTTLTSLTVAGT